MKQVSSLSIVFLISAASFAQLQSISLQNIQACNGATLIASPLWGSGSVNPVTLYYEKQTSPVNWVAIVTQVYDYRSNYIIITPSDISVATFYRVRAIDEVTHQEFISTGVSVNPATWGVDRGAASVTALAYWGADCNNSENYLEVIAYYTTNGRPPFTIEYKKATDASYLVAGTVTAGTRIYGIVPNTTYSIRVTDFCGKVNIINNLRLDFITNYSILQNATTCTNGKVIVNPNADARYRGIPPYTYALGKIVADMGGAIYPPMNFVAANVFDNLGPGDYYAQLKDACGNLSNYQFIRLGAGFPRISTAVTSIPADSCFRNITVTTSTGTSPFQYGIRYIQDAAFTYQAGNVFTNLSRNGVYFFRVKDACVQLSDSVPGFANFPIARIDSIKRVFTVSTCIKDIKVYGSSGYKPYQYAIRQQGVGSFVYQVSDTFRNVTPGVYEIKIKDRCGRESAVNIINENTADCALRTTAGDFESGNSPQGCADYSGNNWTDLKDDGGKLIFSINPQNNFLPDLCWGVRIVAGNGSSLRNASINGNTTYFLDRNFYIEPQNPITLNNPVSIRIYITNAELQNMLSYLSSTFGMPVTKDDLKILKKKGSAGSPVDLEVTNDGSASSAQFTILHPTILPFGNDWYMEFSVTDFSEFNPFIGQLTILPLRLLSFDAIKQNNSIALQWSTANEVNTAKFEIEWSTTGTAFQPIGVVPSRNLLSVTHYNFNHNNPVKGLNYYRLKQVDKDGKSAWSKVITVSFSGLQKIMVSPNPATEKLTILLPDQHKYKVLRVLDYSGRLLLQKTITFSSTNIELDIHHFAKGLYMLQVSGEEFQRISFLKR